MLAQFAQEHHALPGLVDGHLQPGLRYGLAFLAQEGAGLAQMAGDGAQTGAHGLAPFGQAAQGELEDGVDRQEAQRIAMPPVVSGRLFQFQQRRTAHERDIELLVRAQAGRVERIQRFEEFLVETVEGAEIVVVEGRQQMIVAFDVEIGGRLGMEAEPGPVIAIDELGQFGHGAVTQSAAWRIS